MKKELSFLIHTFFFFFITALFKANPEAGYIWKEMALGCLLGYAVTPIPTDSHQHSTMVHQEHQTPACQAEEVEVLHVWAEQPSEVQPL